MVDGFFLLDIIINFLSAYENSEGKTIVNCKSIAVNYLTGWFLLDLSTSIPVQLLEAIFLYWIQ